MAKKGTLKVYLGTWANGEIKTEALIIAAGKKAAKKAALDGMVFPGNSNLELSRVKVKPHFVQVLKQVAD